MNYVLNVQVMTPPGDDVRLNSKFVKSFRRMIRGYVHEDDGRYHDKLD